MEGLLDEVISLGRYKVDGIPEDMAGSVLEKGASFPRETRTSFQQDIESGKPRSEMDIFGGTLKKIASEAGIKTPFLDRIAEGIGK